MKIIDAVKMPQPRHAKILPQPEARSAWRRPAAYPTYMNFIVGRMIISDMRTSCDQYALLHRDAGKTRAVGGAGSAESRFSETLRLVHVQWGV
jgi:hypothetical protein